jgi:hypothetical protein
MNNPGVEEALCADDSMHSAHMWGSPDDGAWCPGTIDRDDRAEGELRAWWMSLARRDMDAVVPKAVEYSAYDLDIMGHALLAWSGQEWGANGGRGGADAQERSAVGQEMAIAYYVLGKVSRLIGAYHEGKLPSNDTWDDIRIYATMAARVRETGRWGL